MKRLLVVITALALLSCGKDKVIQLPEINHSNIHNVHDVSAAYLFYDENEKDSVDLNRKNLISSTNWLINVDKRLSLKQAMPHISFLQKKKNNSSHKNIKSKNYFTCNDTSIKNLGFIDFTNVVYHTEPVGAYFIKNSNLSIKNKLTIVFYSLENIEIMGATNQYISTTTNLNKLIVDLKNLINQNTSVKFILNFNQNLSFQNYISIKSKLLTLETKHGAILNDEFIFN